MSILSFDALSYIDELVKSGVDEQQAKSQVKVLQKALNEAVNNELATKSDLKDLALRLVKWMIASQVSTIVVLVAILKIL